MTDDESSELVVQKLAYINIYMAIVNSVAAILFLFPAFSFVFNRRDSAYKSKYKDEEKNERNKGKDKPASEDTDKETDESEDKETDENKVEYWDKGKDDDDGCCSVYHQPRGWLSVWWAVGVGYSIVLLTKYPEEEPVNMSYVVVVINCILDLPMLIYANFLPHP